MSQAASYSQSLERGLAILAAFRSGRSLLGVAELGREVGLSRSTSHRYVATLAALGYLEQDSATRKYRLGPRVLDLGFSAINSMDKVLLAHLPRDDQQARLARLELARRGPNTITSRRALEAELARVRENGFAINNEELAYGLRSIAAPVLGRDGTGAAAINLAVHSSMASTDELGARFGPALLRTAAGISARLGYRT